MSDSGMILVVDDNAGNQYVARAVLERYGYKTRIVANGEEALDAFSVGQYDLILMDCRMPIMDGYEATEAIRKAEEVMGGHIPIIGVTAYAFEGDREKCLEAGMDDYVMKPLTLEGFKNVLTRWLPAGNGAF
jgi:CheY-like chemotaxis protein